MKKQIVVIVVAVVLIGAAALSASTPASWDPNDITLELVAGEETVQTVALTARKDMESVIITFEGDITGVVSAEPSALGNIAKGETREVVLTFTPSADAEDGTELEGQLKLRQDGPPNRAYPSHLNIDVVIVWPTAGEEAGFTVSYPPELLAEEVVSGLERKVLFYDHEPSFGGEDALFFVHVNSLRGNATVRDWLLAQAVAEGDISEVVVGNHIYFRSTRALGDERSFVAYSAPYGASDVISVTLYEPSLEQTPEFQTILNSLDF
ncbi:hypothetical protein L0Y40_00595 [Candidatus Wolfebacteria bacterium]|nr:hypothetical protein [Candidatus Wolfebacteria bacterium]